MPISKPSFILIHPTVWPQYVKVTDRRDRQDRQLSDSIGRTVLEKVAQKRRMVFVVVQRDAVLVSCLFESVQYDGLLSRRADGKLLHTADKTPLSG